jgi:16S rRNA processing protein RimM
VRGELKCRVVTDFPAERFKPGRRLLLGQASRQVRSARVRGNLVYLRLEGIEDRNAAEAVRGLDVLVPRAEAVRLPAGQFFWDEVIGLRVEDTTGRPLGSVTDILETGANHVYVVQPDQRAGGGGKEILVPAIKDVVRSIDPSAGRMVIDPLPGLLA